MKSFQLFVFVSLLTFCAVSAVGQKDVEFMGRVVDRSGQAVVNAIIVLDRKDRNSLMSAGPSVSYRTSDRGEYSFVGKSRAGERMIVRAMDPRCSVQYCPTFAKAGIFAGDVAAANVLIRGREMKVPLIYLSPYSTFRLEIPERNENLRKAVVDRYVYLRIYNSKRQIVVEQSINAGSTDGGSVEFLLPEGYWDIDIIMRPAGKVISSYRGVAKSGTLVRLPMS
jgi:hypothetical protein